MYLFVCTGGPPLVQSLLVRIPLVQINKVISKICTSGISKIGCVVKFILKEIGYVVPAGTNFPFPGPKNHT